LAEVNIVTGHHPIVRAGSSPVPHDDDLLFVLVATTLGARNALDPTQVLES
jgi:hypothetical protein